MLHVGIDGEFVAAEVHSHDLALLHVGFTVVPIGYKLEYNHLLLNLCEKAC